MLGHGAGIGYTGPGPRMGPIDNFSLLTGSLVVILEVGKEALRLRQYILYVLMLRTISHLIGSENEVCM